MSSPPFPPCFRTRIPGSCGFHTGASSVPLAFFDRFQARPGRPEISLGGTSRFRSDRRWHLLSFSGTSSTPWQVRKTFVAVFKRAEVSTSPRSLFSRVFVLFPPQTRSDQVTAWYYICFTKIDFEVRLRSLFRFRD